MDDSKPFARVETTFRGKGTESERMVRVLLCDDSSLLWPGRPVGEIVSALNAAHDSSIARLRAELDAAKAETERERMRLVACGVVALSDTPESMDAQLSKIASDYRSASLDDVTRTVRALISARAALAKEREACDEWRTLYADAVDPRKVRSDPYGAQQNANAQRLAMMHDARRAAAAKEPKCDS